LTFSRVERYGFLTRRSICNFLMFQKVFKDDYFLPVSSARRLVNISGTVREREEVEVYKRLY
jgi:hypothetical protein